MHVCITEEDMERAISFLFAHPCCVLPMGYWFAATKIYDITFYSRNLRFVAGELFVNGGDCSKTSRGTEEAGASHNLRESKTETSLSEDRARAWRKWSEVLVDE